MISQTFIAAAVSLLFHTLIVLAIWLGVEVSTEEQRIFKPQQIIKASLVELKPQATKADNTPNVIDLNKRRQQQLERQKRLEREKQKKLLLEQERQKQLQKKQEQEKKQLEQQELERKKRRQQEKDQEAQRLQRLKDQQQELSLFDEALEAELNEQQAYEQQQVIQSYQQYIYQRTRQYWSRPPSARNGMKVLLAVNLVPTGEVNSVQILEGSGNDSFDRSAVQAVQKASPYKQLREMQATDFEKNFRNFNLLFNPQDLRQ